MYCPDSGFCKNNNGIAEEEKARAQLRNVRASLRMGLQAESCKGHLSYTGDYYFLLFLFLFFSKEKNTFLRVRVLNHLLLKNQVDSVLPWETWPD